MEDEDAFVALKRVIQLLPGELECQPLGREHDRRAMRVMRIDD